MRIFFDTEFMDQGKGVLHPLSFGFVREDMETYYAEVEDVDLSLADNWVKENVIKKFTGPKKTRNQIAFELRDFCDYRPEFWTFCGAADYVVLFQLYGRMLDIPKGWPHYTKDITIYGNSFKFSQWDETKRHHALYDAHWTKLSYDGIQKQIQERGTSLFLPDKPKLILDSK